MTKEQKIDQRIFDLYDEYCHGRMDRREFLAKAAAITVGGVSALWMAQALLPRYAEAQTISFTDPRMTGTYVTYPSPGGTSGEMRGYLVQPAGEGPFPSVLIIHENRGLNPHIEDVARRAAVAGFLALAPDGLAPVGGYPGNDDDGRELQRGLNPEELDLYEKIYHHLTLDAPRPDLVIYLQAPVEILCERIARRGIDYEQQIRDDYLLRLSDSYTRFFHDYEDSALLTVNTQSVDLINNEADYQAILEKINNIHSGRHYFNQSSFAL